MATQVGEIEYEIEPRDDGTFAVTIRAGTAIPRTVPGFDSEAEAEAWVFRQLEETKDGGLPRHL